MIVTAGNQEVRGRRLRDRCPVPESCYFELVEVLPLSTLFSPPSPSSVYGTVHLELLLCIVGVGGHPHQRRQHRFRHPLLWAWSGGQFFPTYTLLLLVLLEGEREDVHFLRGLSAPLGGSLPRGQGFCGQTAVGLAIKGLPGDGQSCPQETQKHHLPGSLSRDPHGGSRAPAMREAEGTSEDACGLSMPALPSFS